ncbi:hypothetical protein [Nocardia crassostreae]|uniref:hypothetical protein n=1 Tax=Nocardia crassostreae TaxID=53428 RepID=UPI00083644BE|nr:hypothetical protein [Nocardia crassostreae]
MKPWEIFGLCLGVAAFCIALPPLLGWRRARLWLLGGLLLLAGAAALLFLPLPHPVGDVDCGTVLHPRHEWIGPPICFDPFSCSEPDFRVQCESNRTDRMQIIALLTLGATGIVLLSVRALRRADRTGADG